MAGSVFAHGFKEQPYWWEAAPRRPEDAGAILPARADVVVVGAGFTGLSAALTLARHGRGVVVLDAEAPGFGASSRNHGYVGVAPMASFTALAKRHGMARAGGIYRETHTAFKYVTELIEREQIHCHYRQCGRIYWAYNRAQLDYKARDLELMREHAGIEGYVIGPEDKRREIMSDFYYGGVAFPGTGACHPGLLVNGLIDRVEAAGATVLGHTRVLAIEQRGTIFDVATSRGTIEAGDVVAATNGYIGKETPYLRRRIIPVNAHIATTEPLAPEILERLFPSGRVNLDLRNNFHSWCIAPDEPRMIFLGQTIRPIYRDSRVVMALHKEMCEIHPELADVGFSHYWNGQLGLTFDRVPHIGRHDGVYYVLGMNGGGLPSGTHLGNKVALKLLGEPDSETAFDDLGFKTMPFYTGRSWFAPLIAGAKQAMARLERRGAGQATTSNE
ncbi:MAG: FAD-binding oxidoreductase [Alphaproteobacteria bacterium]